MIGFEEFLKESGLHWVGDELQTMGNLKYREGHEPEPEYVSVEDLGEWAKARSEMFRGIAFAMCGEGTRHFSNPVIAKIFFDSEQYFDGVADAFQEIANGNCEQLEKRLKGIECRLRELKEKKKT